MRISLLLLLFPCLFFSGCQSGYYSENDFGSLTKIDSHVHINGNTGYFEEVAAEDNFILITLGVDHGDSANISRQHESAGYSAEKHPGRVFYGPTFLFDTAAWGTPEWSRKIIAGLENDLSRGGITVKIWKNIGMTVRDRSGRFIMVDDPGLDPVIDYIKGRGLPITGHLGEPRNCWLPLDQMTVSSDSSYFARNPHYHMFLHPEYPSYEDQINARDNILAKHPDLTFIGCHLASLEWNVDSLAKRLDRFPNMAVDMSARICHLQYQSAQDRKRVRDFCIKYQDRLLYGTDVGDSGNSDPDRFRKSMHETWLDDWKYFTSDDEMTSDKFRGKFTGLMLPKEVVDKIYNKNAVKWYKLNL
jgi:predicted TIM-barrel fold metal-dependent hydrolase